MEGDPAVHYGRRLSVLVIDTLLTVACAAVMSGNFMLLSQCHGADGIAVMLAMHEWDL